MHLAEIMNERTQDEKENFGHVNLDNVIETAAEEEVQNYSDLKQIGYLTESNIDLIIDQFLSSTS